MRAYAFALHHLERRLRRRQRHALCREGRRDPGAGHTRHEIGPTPDRRERKPVRERFAEHHQVRPHAEPLGGAPDGEPERRLDLVEHQHRAHALCLRPQHLEPFARGLDHYHGFHDDDGQAVSRFADQPPRPLGVVERQLGVQSASRGRHAVGALAPVEPAVVATAEHLLAPGGYPGQPHGCGHSLRAGLEKPHALEPWDATAQRLGKLFFEHGRERPHDAGRDRLLGRAIHVRMAVPERHRAQRHDVVHVLATPGVPHAAAGRPHHPLGDARVLAQLGATEQGVRPLTTGRRESRNAPVAHRISPPRWPSRAAASPRAGRAGCGG